MDFFLIITLYIYFLAYCSHTRAYQLMTESIGSTSGFKSRSCESWEKYKDGLCDRNPIVLMGEYASSSWVFFFLFLLLKILLRSIACISSSSRVHLFLELTIFIIICYRLRGKFFLTTKYAPPFAVDWVWTLSTFFFLCFPITKLRQCLSLLSRDLDCQALSTSHTLVFITSFHIIRIIVSFNFCCNWNFLIHCKKWSTTHSSAHHFER